MYHDSTQHTSIIPSIFILTFSQAVWVPETLLFRSHLFDCSPDVCGKKKRTSLSNQLQRFGFIWHWSASPSDWNDSWKRTWGPRDFALSQQWLISKQPFSHENQNRFLSDFMKCAVASADPRSCPACLWRRSGGYFQSSPLLWRLCHISGPLKFSRCFTKTAHLHGYFLFIFESLWIRTTRRHTHRARTATKLYSAPDNTSNPPKRETIPKQKTS